MLNVLSDCVVTSKDHLLEQESFLRVDLARAKVIRSWMAF